jgi:flagellar protein FliO/FliZ
MIRRFYTNDVSPTDKSRRQTRLSVIEGAAAPGGRRLILIRRDNVEHLLMIGGRSDVVIEANIVRAAAPAREAPPPARPQRVPPAEEPATWPAEPAPPLPPRRQPRPADHAELRRASKPRIAKPIASSSAT